MADEYIQNVINNKNYNSSFDFIFDQLPNPSSEKNAEACRKYYSNIQKHITKVAEVWINDTIVDAEPKLHYWTLSGPSEGWGDYIIVDESTTVHGNEDPQNIQPRPLRSIATEEFGLGQQVAADIDNLVRLHDRSRFSEDEFYAAANKFFAGGSESAYEISRLKHYQRNAHEFTHYYYHREDGPSRILYDRPNNGRPVRVYDPVVLEMPDAFLWERFCVWIANYSQLDYVYNLNTHGGEGLNPFQYYWGKDSNYKWVLIDGQWVKVRDTSGPVLPDRIQLSNSLRTKIEKFVDRYSQIIPKPEDP